MIKLIKDLITNIRLTLLIRKNKKNANTGDGDADPYIYK